MKTVNKMPRYSAYKDSGVDWLGDIPEAWHIKRLSFYFTERRTKVSDKDYPALSVTKIGILSQLENAAKTNDGDNRKLVKKGDFVINSRSDRKGSSGVSNLDGSVSLINIVLQPKFINSQFSNYLLKNYSFIEEFYRIGHGIVADLWTTRYEDMKNILLSIPSQKEQIAIVNFLDKKTTQIDQAIAIKQKQIELLKERQQIIIQQAVTKGLDPNVPMKDSGIEWIGMIPEHWNVIPLKRLATINPSIHIQNKNSTELACFLPMEKVSVNGEISCDLMKPIREISQGFTSFAKYDVIIAKITPCFENGKSAYLNNLITTFGYGSTEFHVLRASKLIRGKYLYNIIHSSTFLKMGEAMMTGSAGQKRVPTRFVADFLVCLPSLEEQDKIVNYISQQIEASARVISTYQQQIEKLKEYKTTLIDSAVTGKIKITPEE